MEELKKLLQSNFESTIIDRKSKGFNLGGGFKVKFSQSGVGYSWKMPKIKSVAKRKSDSSPYNTPKVTQVPIDTYDEEIFENSEMSDITDAQFKDLSEAIERTVKINRIGNILLILGIFLIIPLPFGIALKVIARTKGVIELDYEVDSECAEIHKRNIQSWEGVSSSNRVWEILESAKSANIKKSSGAESLVKRVDCKFSRELPFYLKTNVEVIQVKLKKDAILIFPDKYLIIRKGKVGVIHLSDVFLEKSTTNFVETEKVPSDSEIVRYTWKYVNKNGTPDKRHKDNKQLPVCKYGEIRLASGGGVNVYLMASNIDRVNGFNIIKQQI